MPGHLLPVALAAAAAVALGAVSLAPAATPAEPGPAVRGLPAAAPAGGAPGAGVARLPDGAAAAVKAPTAPAAAAPLQRSAGPPVAVTGRPGGAAPAPGHGWRWPLAPAPRVVNPFDVGPFPWSPGHRGVDLAPASGAQGVPVVAAGPGVVRFAGVVAGRGVVSVDHGSGVRTTYEPVTAGVRRGQPVVAGEPLGVLADGGHCAPAVCLHWGAIVDGRYVDPLTLLRPREPPVLLPVPGAGVRPG